jgi:hypothetical protein
MFTAILGCLLGKDWSEPRIAELRLTPDCCLLAQVEGDANFKAFLGAEADLIRNVQGIAEVAGSKLRLLGLCARAANIP